MHHRAYDNLRAAAAGGYDALLNQPAMAGLAMAAAAANWSKTVKAQCGITVPV
jgi:hypothetical protein